MVHRAFRKTGLARVAIGVLRFAVAFMPLEIEPGMGHVRHFGHEGEFFAAEAGRGLPFVAVFIEPSDGDVVANAVVGFVGPYSALDAPKPDLVNRFGLGLVRP